MAAVPRYGVLSAANRNGFNIIIIFLQGSFDDTIHFEDILPTKMESLRNRRALEYTEEVRISR